jgi:hypothetical protein
MVTGDLTDDLLEAGLVHQGTEIPFNMEELISEFLGKTHMDRVYQIIGQ